MDIFSKWLKQQQNKKYHDNEDNHCFVETALYPSEYKNVLFTINEKSVLFSRTLKIKPKAITFRDFTPGNIYNSTLTITNIDKTLHFLRLVCTENFIFKIKHKNSGSLSNAKLAPGISYIFDIRFSPEENKNYEHQINIVTDCEIIKIPIIALWLKSILEIPDKIVMPETIIKIPSSTSILIQNIGNSSVTFSFSINSANYMIIPSCGILEERKSTRVIINFSSETAGNFDDTIFVKYETGELLKVDIKATAITCNISIETTELKIPKTFLGLSSVQSLKIYNNSNYVVKFYWMKFENSKVEMEEKKKFVELYNEIVKNTADMRYVDLEYFNICHHDQHKLICNRIHEDELVSLEQENFFYFDSQFSLQPQKGKILPNDYSNIIVNFKPTSVGEIISTAYLDVAGCENRIPVKIIGDSKGPIIKFAESIIDIGQVYLCSKHNLEVSCLNKGLIPGHIIYKSKPTDFKNNIIICPFNQEIQPKTCSKFDLTFSAMKIGAFVERIEFLIEQSAEILFFFIKGVVICPILYFKEDHLDFKIIDLGFISEHQVILYNASSVPVTCNFSIPEDGTELAVTYKAFNNISIMPNLPINPREFSLNPPRAQVEPYDSIKIKINLTTNIVRTKKCNLRVEIEGSGVSISLPIVYSSKAACFEVIPSTVNNLFCFINFPYTQRITIRNISDVQGYCYFLRQKTSEDSVIFYSMSRNCWHLKPGESRDLSITVITRATGRQIIKLNLVTLGKKSLDSIDIVCNGQGAIISAVPKNLDWGEVELFEEKSLSFKLINDSPIPTTFRIIMENKNSPWMVSPDSGELHALQSIEITVTLFLKDKKKHTDRILFVTSRSAANFVALSAFGQILQLITQVYNGPAYKLLPHALIKFPPLEFSFNHHNFGSYYISGGSCSSNIDFHITKQRLKICNEKPVDSLTGKVTINIVSRGKRKYKALLCCFEESILSFRVNK